MGNETNTNIFNFLRDFFDISPPCPALPQNVLLRQSSDQSAQDIVIQNKPITPNEITKISAFIEESPTPVYISIQGNDHYCVYPVAAPASAFLKYARAPTYGGKSPLKTVLPNRPPTGIIVDANKVAHAPILADNKTENRWYIVGQGNSINKHLRTIDKFSSQLIDQWCEEAIPPPHAEIKIKNLPSAAEGEIAPELEAKVNRALQYFLDWLTLGPQSDTEMADELGGRFNPHLTKSHSNVLLSYDTQHDQFNIFTRTIPKLNQAQYEELSGWMAHELAHQRVHDQDGIEVFGQMARSALAVFTKKVKSEDSPCNRMILQKHVIAITNWLIKESPIDEAIAYAAQLVYAKRLTPEISQKIVEMFAVERQRVLGKINSQGWPVEILELARDYYVNGLRVAAAPWADPHELTPFIADYDREIACGHGKPNSCSFIPHK